MNYTYCYLLILLFSATNSCKKDHNQLSPEISISTNGGQTDQETKIMIDSVQTAQDAVDPSKLTIFLSSLRAENYKKQLPTFTGLAKANLMVTYGFEELKAGNTKAAMQAFTDVLAFVEPMQIPGKEQTILEVKKLLALSALRLGEQENCILNHTSASCVIPIAQPGQHTKTEGSRQAMNLYIDILKQTPDDLTSRYLLNIAAMTLGEFPGGVPAEMRLPKGYFTSKVAFPPFTDIAKSMGLDRRGLAGGIAIEDFDRDGHLDIMHTSWGFHDQIKYHHNNGDGTFTDIALTSGLNGVTGGLNIRHADYNNDGYPDVLILRGAWFRDQGRIPNSLLRNNGNGTFTDVTIKAGLYNKRPTQNAVWADFDLDGWLDLFIGNESIPEAGSAFNFPSELYHNQQDGTFKEVLTSSGLNVNAFIKGSAGGDINNDGKEDIYLSLLNGTNQLFLNVSDETGLHFKNITGTADVGEPFVSFPTWMFDFNNDGWLDIFVSAYSDGSEDLPGKVLRAYGTTDDPFRPRLYRNNKDLTFTDISSIAGLTEPAFTMGSNYGDLDADGFPDIYLGTGEPNLKSIVPNKMYWNRNGEKYDDITYAIGFGNIQKGHGVGFGDMDHDGDEDLYVVMGGSFEGDVYQNLFFENPIGQQQSWIVLQLEGVTANKSALGARVAVEISEQGKTRTIYQTVSSGSSFGGNSLQLEMGLGKADKINKITIHWPSLKAKDQLFSNVALNKAFKVIEGKEPEPVDYHPTPFKPDATDHSHHNH
ncbi:MAG: CRTAC1 family protein [Bacteroidota bacterium]|nr:CRTAC1 family protein [Bacteroidota bacterium]